jgi:TolB-like protein/Flp pilus assembly protein TadD
MSSFFAELQRRNVYKVGAMYAVSGWLLVQVATQVFPFFDVPNWAVRLVVLVIAAGFPVVLVLSWIYELTPQGIVKTDEVAPATSITRNTGQKLNHAIIAVLVVAVLVLLAKVFWPHAASGPAEAVSEKSIAVLPFDSLSDDKANAYFAEGIQDEILTKLAGIGDLKVISRTSTEKYKSHPDNLKTVAAELGVGRLLEGSVQKSGDKVRVNVQLIDAPSDAHLWANTYDRDLKDVFAVESEVSQDIADALKAKLSPGEAGALASVPTHNSEAYDFFLMGEHENHQGRLDEAEDFYLAAEKDYRQAINRDPGFALAYARLADAQLTRHWFTHKPPNAAEEDEIKAEIGRALELAPDLAEAHLSKGYLHYWVHYDFEAAIAEFQEVIRLEPSNAQAMQGVAAVERRKGQWPEALGEFARAAAVAPRDSALLCEYALTLDFMHRYAEADQVYAQALAIDPDNLRGVYYQRRHRLLGQGDVAGARQGADKLSAGALAVFDRLGGDVLSLIGTRNYADIYDRRFDDVLAAVAAAPTDTPEQQQRRMGARVAIQVLAGRKAAARPDCEALQSRLQPELAQRPDDPLLLTLLAWADICLGHGDDAVKLMQHLVDLLPLSKDHYFGNFGLVGLAEVQAQTGHSAEALSLIQQLLSIPAGGVLSTARLRLDPVWDPLRGDPGFQKLAAAAAVPVE